MDPATDRLSLIGVLAPIGALAVASLRDAAVLPLTAATAAGSALFLVLAAPARSLGAAALVTAGALPALACAAWLDGAAAVDAAPALGAIVLAAALALGLARLGGSAAGVWIALVAGLPPFLLEAIRVVRPREEPSAALIRLSACSPPVAAVRGDLLPLLVVTLLAWLLIRRPR